MTYPEVVSAAPGRKTTLSLADHLQAWLPRLVLAPTAVLILVFFYGFILWTGVISMTHVSGQLK